MRDTRVNELETMILEIDYGKKFICVALVDRILVFMHEKEKFETKMSNQLNVAFSVGYTGD